jgi:hypothetical protein
MNPLKTILALLVLAPHPLTALEVGVFTGIVEADASRLLRQMGEAGYAREEAPNRWVPGSGQGVLREAVSEVRRRHRDRELTAMHVALEEATTSTASPLPRGTRSAAAVAAAVAA